MPKRAFVLAVATLISAIACSSPASATCPVPYTLTNGQVADATQVMDNFNTLGNCATSKTGSPTVGGLSVFSNTNSITSGNLTGDVTTSNGTVTTLAPSGVTPGSYINPYITVDAKGRITAASNGATGGSFRGVLVKKAANQVAANYSGTATVVWDSEVYDTDEIHDSITNNTRLTVPIGVTKVRLRTQMGMSSVTNGAIMVLAMTKNGTQSFPGYPTSRDAIANPDPEFQTISPVLEVTAGDYFEVLFTNTDSSITVDHDRSWFAMEIVD